MVRYLICRLKKQDHQWPTKCTRSTGILLQWINKITTANLQHRDAADRNIIFTRVQQKRLVTLKDWVNDRKILNEETTFETGTTWDNFIEATVEALECRKFRKDQKKVG